MFKADSPSYAHKVEAAKIETSKVQQRTISGVMRAYHRAERL